MGFVALVGAGSVFMVPLAGRLIDRPGPDVVNLVCFAGMVLAAVVLLTGLLHSVAGLIGLVIGMLLPDISVQTSQVANQSRIFALLPSARSRLNSIYMTAVFLGGTVGSWVGARIYLSAGWGALCALVAGAGVLALLRHVLRRLPASVSRSPATSPVPAPRGSSCPAERRSRPRSDAS
jgi:predicted MFS family arabinose efflux permease